MQRGSDIGVSLLKVLALLAVAAGLYAGWKVLPYYLKSRKFQQQMAAEADLWGGREDLAESLRAAIYRDARNAGLPVQREDIRVDYTPTGFHVAVDYTVTADLGFGEFALHFHPHSPEPSQTFPPLERGFLAVLGLVLGLYWFFKGLRLLQEFLVIADTPLTPIRSVAMGRVQIHGRAVGKKTMQSPVANQLCFLYKVEIERWAAGQRGGGRWFPYLEDQGSVGFYLEDETGKVLVDSRAAELDLDEPYQCQVTGREILSPDAPWKAETPAARPSGFPTPDSELRAYVRRVAAGINTAAFQGGDLPVPGAPVRRRKRPWRSLAASLGGLQGVSPLDSLNDGAAPGDYRLTEYCVVPGNEYDITGTCAMNPHAQGDSDRQVITQSQNEKTFLISDQSEKGLEQDLRVRVWRHILGGGLIAVVGAAVLLEALGFLP